MKRNNNGSGNSFELNKGFYFSFLIIFLFNEEFNYLETNPSYRNNGSITTKT